jgi:hypothetical protein
MQHSSCARRDGQFGRGQNTGMGWSDPTLAHGSVAKVTRGVAPAHTRSPKVRTMHTSAISIP